MRAALLLSALAVGALWHLRHTAPKTPRADRSVADVEPAAARTWPLANAAAPAAPARRDAGTAFRAEWREVMDRIEGGSPHPQELVRWPVPEPLRRPVEVRVEALPLADAVARLSLGAGVPVVLDPGVRDVFGERPVTLAAGPTTLGDALSLALREAEADVFAELDGSVVRLRELTVLRIHPVADLLPSAGPFFNDDAPEIRLVPSRYRPPAEPGAFAPPPPREPGAWPTFDAEVAGGVATSAAAGTGRLAEIVRARCAAGRWGADGFELTAQGRNLVVHAPPSVQAEVAACLDALR